MDSNRRRLLAGLGVALGAPLQALGQSKPPPGDLPVEQATTLELCVNLRTAKSLGITTPASVLARADRVVQ